MPAVTPLLAPPLDERFRRYESLRSALDLIDQGFTLVDSELRFVAWNKTFLRLLDFPPEMGYVGAPFESFLRFNAARGEYGAGDTQGQVDERMLAARAFSAHEFERTRPDGTVLLVRGVPVPGHGFVTLYSNITARKNAQAQIAEHTALLESRVAQRTAELRLSEAKMFQAQKMEALGQLSGGLAHDFNNILTVIIGNLSALSDARDADPTVAEYVVPAVAAARRGAELIKGLLTFAHKQPLEAQAADAAPLLHAVGRLVRRSLPENLNLEIDAGGAALWTWIDAQQLQNTLLNLIFNARDATQAQAQGRQRRGQATIGLHASAQALDPAAAAPLRIEPGDYVRIDVSDNGSGMDPATLARVFEPFFTTKAAGRGTGLGMAMAYGFAKQSGGAIDVRSGVGQGTTVSLWLPACEGGGEARLPADPDRNAARADRGLALLVEDDPEVRKVVRRMLLELGFAVIEAENGVEAKQILEQTPGIALLLSDVVMPAGVGGRELAAFAREHRGVPRVVLMSGYAPEPESAPGPPRRGASPPRLPVRPIDVGVVPKPFTKAQLAAAIAAAST